MECLAALLLMPGSMAQMSSESVAPLDFEAIVRQYRSRIFRFILASLRDEDTAHTLTQDCFLRAHRALKEFRGESSLDTWLLKIAANLVRDHARNRRLQFWKRTQAHAKPFEEMASALSDRGRSAEANALAREQVQAIWLAAEKLSERQRTVFLLRFVEDMDLLEIAAATGLKEGTVKAHLFRALQAVRERIGIVV
jgi:RNA polymerase sigma-70 factor (ECF subfamily)